MRKITSWIFEGEGDHKGHVFVKDKYGIDFHGYDPETSYWCQDCEMSVTITNAEESDPSEEVK